MKQAHKVIAMAVLQQMKQQKIAEVARLDAEVERLKQEEKVILGQMFALDAFAEIERAAD